MQSYDSQLSMLDTLDDSELQEAIDIYKHFDKTTLDKAMSKASQYVKQVKDMCISCDVQSPLVDSIVDMETFNINLLCKQVFYAMHAIDSIFEKIDAQGGNLADFAMMIKLQNDAQSLVNQYIAYVRTLPQVIAAQAQLMHAQEANVLQTAQLGAGDTQGAQDGKALINPHTETIVSRTIVDVIKTIEKHQDVIDSTLNADDDDIETKFEPSEEVKALFANDERYTDEQTYAERLAAEGREFDVQKELSVQAKPTKQVKQ